MGGALGTILASIGIPMLLNAITGKGAPRIGRYRSLKGRRAPRMGRYRPTLSIGRGKKRRAAAFC